MQLNSKTIRIAVMFGGFLFSNTTRSQAQLLVDLGVAGSTISNTQSSTFDAYLRYSPTNFDQVMDAGGIRTTNGLFTGNNGSVTYDFNVSHTGATNGYVWTLTNGTKTGSNVISSTSGTLSGIDTTRNSNIIDIFLRATLSANQAASYKNLLFSGTNIFTQGSLVDTTSVSNGSYHQYIAAPTGTDLSLYDWTLSGSVTLALVGSANSDEQLKLQIGTFGATYTPFVVPEPGSVSFLAAGLGIFALRFRRTRQ